jgi:hypothetical protein
MATFTKKQHSDLSIKAHKLYEKAIEHAFWEDDECGYLAPPHIIGWNTKGQRLMRRVYRILGE